MKNHRGWAPSVKCTASRAFYLMNELALLILCLAEKPLQADALLRALNCQKHTDVDGHLTATYHVTVYFRAPKPNSLAPWEPPHWVWPSKSLSCPQRFPLSRCAGLVLKRYIHWMAASNFDPNRLLFQKNGRKVLTEHRHLFNFEYSSCAVSMLHM